MKIKNISIHTLRVEGDKIKICKKVEFFISIHTLRVEGDRTDTFYNTLFAQKFQSTPSAWRVTDI